MYFEAKKQAKSIGSVGRMTYVGVLDSDNSHKVTSFHLDGQLMKLVEEYGPRSVPYDLKFDGEYYFYPPEE